MYYSITLLQKIDASFKKMRSKNEFQGAALLSITECLKVLKDFQALSYIPETFQRLNKVPPKDLARKRVELKRFCLGNACLIFCTASSSIKLCKNDPPIEMVLIDEAAQLKECEPLIPLELPGVRNAVLVGDERQLPSMFQSKVCEEAKFRRSLFERLVLLGHEKHLLNIQYRMHPTISLFPNSEFYEGKIVDAPNVIETTHEKYFLDGGSYFDNVALENNYNTYSFGGQKKFVLSTTTWIGGKNDFLGIAYLTVGGISLFMALNFVLLYIFKPSGFVHTLIRKPGINLRQLQGDMHS
ncbi:P-loop containing nucleoside triphosphate hydrolase [Artemisia annua]|uniref:P-loop containing nucleoside triphosphate hydrolase n=1 Tax=Artemisia annua TaxID=35608 RepID=A0A2U1QM57_ARTAN|nr:P-loop containing nucleoside triphosphate hydrolase [Artemisia annua]